MPYQLIDIDNTSAKHTRKVKMPTLFFEMQVKHKPLAQGCNIR